MKILPMDIFEAFGRYESHVWTNWLAIWHTHIHTHTHTHTLYGFLKILNFQNFSWVFFFTLDFLKCQLKKTNIAISRTQLCTTQHFASYDVLQFEIAYEMQEKWKFNICLILPKNRVKWRYKNAIFMKFSDGFRQHFHSMCPIDAKEGTASFVLIA